MKPFKLLLQIMCQNGNTGNELDVSIGKRLPKRLVGCLVKFYGISTNVGHLMPILFYTYILNIRFLSTFCRYIFT